MGNLWREWIVDNPMLGEAERAVRRMTRSGGDNARGVNLVALIFVGIFYLWVLSVILRTRESIAGPLLFFELTIMNLVLPGIIYNALSGEFEKATWEALVLTRLSTAQIVVGKLAWRLGMALGISAIFLLPMLLSLIIGDQGDRVSWAAALEGKLLVAGWSFLLCGFGLWVSAHTSKSVTSISTIIGTLIFVLVLLPIVFGLFGINVGFSDRNMGYESLIISIMNPYILLSALLSNSFREGTADGVWIGAIMFYLVGGFAFIWLTYRSLRRRDTAILGGARSATL